ncbi:hypothetical protein [Zavarzinia sp. CC-PAN008]|uniref:hypothetical protein n=1 Tax=Zavarzinia sp. CC-PAN008 TaxID=3243332 RepID=UPI003F745052
MPEAMMFDEHEVAAYLGRTWNWFRKARKRLYTSGFPRPDPLLRRTDKTSIDRWLEQRRPAALRQGPDVAGSDQADVLDQRAAQLAARGRRNTAARSSGARA